ncbi:MarR family winged helix-turn-helix transcriptional regulator [Subtercola lobariae]|uniref:MarR family transcriptional regulator n=1 Tax=Subtercola lobariae TaxID=1588641 RepID=A0A917EZX1_9MICO|nr:MarR family transcriptional regulator [Subtercola lobariae]GGF30817.1 MarR family transcriptional regulator [Subtercola lobariae]
MTRLTEAEERAWSGMLNVTAALRKRMGAIVYEAAGLSETDYTVLVPIVYAGDTPLRSSELAEAINWDRSRLSHHLGRMETRGLIRRTQHSEDNRGAVLHITDSGLAALRQASGPHLRSIKSLFADALSATQIEALTEIVEDLERHLATH